MPSASSFHLCFSLKHSVEKWAAYSREQICQVIHHALRAEEVYITLIAVLDKQGGCWHDELKGI